MDYRIPFNKPFLTGLELDYIRDAVQSGKISGNGTFTGRCQRFFEERYGIGKALLTTSCTDALEMCALLMDVGPEDEIIVPSYTFVSSALAFEREGAKLVFCDSTASHPNIDPQEIEKSITSRTKAIVVVHYAGMACDMDAIMKLAELHNLFVVEDAAQAVESYHIGVQGTRALGSIGHFSAFSFHETKNVISGEGGLLGINDERFYERAEIIWEKGTDRARFFRGEIDKYGWVDTGSSFLPSEVTAAFLWAQLEQLDDIQATRQGLTQAYSAALEPLARAGCFQVPEVPRHATDNAHMFYLLIADIDERSALISHLKSKGILAVFHYLSLHKSPYYAGKHSVTTMPNADRFTDTLLRLPLFKEMSGDEQMSVTAAIQDFYSAKTQSLADTASVQR